MAVQFISVTGIKITAERHGGKNLRCHHCFWLNKILMSVHHFKRSRPVHHFLSSFQLWWRTEQNVTAGLNLGPGDHLMANGPVHSSKGTNNDASFSQILITYSSSMEETTTHVLVLFAQTLVGLHPFVFGTSMRLCSANNRLLGKWRDLWLPYLLTSACWGILLLWGWWQQQINTGCTESTIKIFKRKQ